MNLWDICEQQTRIQVKEATPLGEEQKIHKEEIHECHFKNELEWAGLCRGRAGVCWGISLRVGKATYSKE